MLDVRKSMRKSLRRYNSRADRRRRLAFERLEKRRMLAFLTPSLELVWSNSTAEAHYQRYREDDITTLEDAYFQTEPWDDSDFARFYYYSQSAPADPNAQLDAYSEGDASARGFLYLGPKSGSAGLFYGDAYSHVDIFPSLFSEVRNAEAQSNSEMRVRFLVEADANDPPGSAVNVNFRLSTFRDGIGANGYTLTGPGVSFNGDFENKLPNEESPHVTRNEVFQVYPGDEMLLSWYASSFGSAGRSSAAIAKSKIRVSLEVLAPDLVINDLRWDRDPLNQGGVVLSHAVSKAPVTNDTFVTLYWSTGPKPDGIIGGPLFARSIGKGFESYGNEVISADTIGEPPIDAAFLIAVYDQLNHVKEHDESNNYRALSLKPDLYAYDLQWREDQEGASFRYRIDMPKLRGLPQSIEQRADIELFWANDRTPIGEPIYKSTSALMGGDYGPFSLLIPRSPAPKDATGLVVVVDGGNAIDEEDEENNIAVLKLPDLVGELWDWNIQRDDDSTKRGLDFAFSVNDADSRDDVEVEFYWSRGPEYASRILPAAGRRVLRNEGQEGYHGDFNEPARWGSPPPGTTHILFVIDPLNKIKESDESNNVMAIPLSSAADVLKDSVAFEAFGTLIEGHFRPGGGEITMSEAEVALGVDHFNWVQHIVSIPEHWAIFQVLGPTSALDVSLPALDPLDTIDNTNELVVLNEDLGRGVKFAFDMVDRHPFYYNEPSEIRRFTSSRFLRFSDEPQFPHDFLYEGDFVQFQIRLAGVSYQLADVRLPGVGKVQWKSNTIYDADDNLEGAVYLRVTEDMEVPVPVGGGVFDIEEIAAAVAPWQNAAEPWDVDGNGSIQPLDALLVLKFFGIQRRDPSVVPVDFAIPFYDVNGDMRIEPLDALLVLLEIARRNSMPSGEGEAIGATTPPSAVSAPINLLGTSSFSRPDGFSGIESRTSRQRERFGNASLIDVTVSPEMRTPRAWDPHSIMLHSNIHPSRDVIVRRGSLMPLTCRLAEIDEAIYQLTLLDAT